MDYIISTPIIIATTLILSYSYKFWIKNKNFSFRRGNILASENKELMKALREERDFYRSESQKLNDKLNTVLYEMAEYKKENAMLISLNRELEKHNRELIDKVEILESKVDKLINK